MSRFPLRLMVCLPFLAALSYFVLMLPIWSDWKQALQMSQRTALQVSASAVARMLAEDERYLQFLEDEVAEVIYRAVPIESALTLDGRRDDWPALAPIALDIDHLLEVNEPYRADSLTGALAVGADSRFLYLHLEVLDDTVVYRALNSLSVHRNDHVQLAVVDHDGVYRRFTVSVLQPGEITVSELSASGRALREANDITGRWLATETGYNVEMRVPHQLARRRFSVVIGDVDNPLGRDVTTVMGLSSTSAVEELGTLIYSPTELERVMAALPYAVRLQSNGGITVASRGFDEMAAFVESTASVKVGDFESGQVTLRQALAPSDALAVALRQQAVVMFLLVLLVIAAATLMVWLILQARLGAVQRQLQEHVDKREMRPLNLESDDPLAHFAEALSSQLIRTHEHNDYLERMASRLNHELRTPVSVVKSSLENLQASELDNNQAVYIDRAIQGVGRLTNILNKMSEARRLEEALDEEEVAPFDLVEVVSGCLAGYESAFPQVRFELLTEVEEALVTGIPELVAQLLDKLIDNAIEFSSGDTIKLRLHQDGDHILLRVLNEGPELPQEATDSLFSSMVSIRDHAKETHLGLGLYIARTIARFHGGDLAIANREDARGVIVTLRLPLLRLTSRLAGSRAD